MIISLFTIIISYKRVSSIYSVIGMDKLVLQEIDTLHPYNRDILRDLNCNCFIFANILRTPQGITAIYPAIIYYHIPGL